MFKKVHFMTQSNTYDTPLGDQAKGKVVDQPSTSTPLTYFNPLQIEKPISNIVLRHPKSVIRKDTFNPNDHASQNYNIIEDFAQVPCAMSTLNVLKNCPSQHRILLSAIGVMDPEESNMITFNLDYFKERLPHHLAFQIQILVGGKNIHRTILDEGASTYVMSLSCWKSLISPKLS
jgi:hypothetical protein